MEKLNAGVKHDQNKLPWMLMPWDALRGICSVLAFGAKKYEPRNWEKGMEWDRLFRATIEHMTLWFDGEKDPETGYSHLWHAGCCILFLIAYEIRGVGIDNRPKKLLNQEPPTNNWKTLQTPTGPVAVKTYDN